MPSAAAFAEPVPAVEENCEEVGSLEHLKSSDAFPKLKAQQVAIGCELQEPFSLSSPSPGTQSSRDHSHIAPPPPFSTAEPPFPLLPGEYVKQFGRISPSTQLFLTNFRLFFLLEQQGFYNIPLPCVDGVEARDMSSLHISCKDGRIVKVVADNSENCLLWYKLLTTVAQGVSKREEIFAFAFHAWCTDEGRQIPLGLRLLDVYSPKNLEPMELSQARAPVLAEFKRLEFCENVWRISDRNENYKLCDTYPRFLIVPGWLTDEELDRCAQHRFLNRMPAIGIIHKLRDTCSQVSGHVKGLEPFMSVWRHRKRGSILLRSSQPTAGLFGWRCPEDELYLQALLTACARQPGPPAALTQRALANGHCVSQGGSSDSQGTLVTQSMLILDARSYAAAWANRAKGGGFESPEYYQRCEVQFMGLPNIHTIRSSFQQLRALLSSEGVEQSTWLQTLQGTQWLQHLSSLFSVSLVAVEALNNCGRSVLVHCSDGWDRTTQIITLAKLLLDPHYRTMRGFRELVEREWIEFGHKFADRCGMLNKNLGEKSPVFLQWLDCVHQLYHQFPGAFEFNQAYLVKLAQHAYSGLFGTFLSNSIREASCQLVNQRTFSVWAYLHPDNAQFRNLIYEWEQGILWPEYQLKDLREHPEFTRHFHSYTLWKEVYCSGQPTGLPRPRSGSVQSVGGGTMERSLTRAHSCDSLTSGGGASDSNPTLCAERPFMRTGSDSNINPVSPAPACASNIQFSVGQQGAQPDPAKQGQNEEVVFVLDQVLSRVSESESEEPVTPRPDGIGKDIFDIDNISNSNGEDNNSREDYSLLSLCGLEPPDCNRPGYQCSCTNYSDAVLNEAVSDVVHRSSTSSKVQNGYNRSTGMVSKSSGTGTGSGSEIERFGSVVLRRSVRKKWRKRRTITDWLDSDGLTTLVDVQQERMREMHKNYLKLYEKMECEMQRMRLLLRHQQNGFPAYNCTNGICVPGANEVNGDTLEPHSVDSVGGQSDVSWEAIDEDDGQPTKWIPDHAVSHCMSCDAEFWTINRKHHCRNCGKIFCSQCSRFECPVPEEQLYEPVRVCNTCYHILRSQIIQTVS